MVNDKSAQDPHRPLEYDLRKYLLLLATLVATVTYAAGFNPPGGVWQETEAGHLAGESIIRDTYYPRYIMFFYCNAAAFALSIVVIVLIFILAVLHEKKGLWIPMFPLRLAMVLNLVGLAGAYAAGTSRHALTAGNLSALAAVFLYMIAQTVMTQFLGNDERMEAISQGTGNPPNPELSAEAISSMVSQEELQPEPGKEKEEEKKRHRKVLMLLATFVMSVTYVAGLSAPGGYWESSQEGRHHAGDPVLWVHHSVRLRAFFVCNTTSFVASLLIIMLLLDHKQKIIFLPMDMKRKAVTGRAHMLYAYITIALVGLVGAYVAGSCRHSDTTIYALSLVAAVLICIGILKVVLGCMPKLSQTPKPNSRSGENNQDTFSDKTPTNGDIQSNMSKKDDILEKAQSLVILLSTLVATVTYQAGLVPPGGVWQENRDGHKAGKPILMSTQAKRYKIKGMTESLETQVKKKDENKAKQHAKRKYLMLLGVLAASVTYQAGLNPPDGVWQHSNNGYTVGDPVMHDNMRHRYHIFFYSHSFSFVASVVVIILLLLPEELLQKNRWLMVMNVTIVLDLLGLLLAYVSGCSMRWEPSAFVIVMVVAVLGCAAAHKFLSIIGRYQKLRKKIECCIVRGINNNNREVV